MFKMYRIIVHEMPNLLLNVVLFLHLHIFNSIVVVWYCKF